MYTRFEMSGYIVLAEWCKNTRNGIVSWVVMKNTKLV